MAAAVRNQILGMSFACSELRMPKLTVSKSQRQVPLWRNQELRDHHLPRFGGAVRKHQGISSHPR